MDACLPAPEPSPAAAERALPLVDLLLQSLESAVAADVQQAQEYATVPPHKP